MNCPECGCVLEKNARFCPTCYARIEPPSLWRRFLSWFQKPTNPARSVITIKKTVDIKTTDADGHRHDYHSLKEVPPELRAELEKLQTEAEKQAFSASTSEGVTSTFITRKSASIFKVKDASGTERIYHSLDELPPEIRAAFEKAQNQLNENNSASG